MDPRVLVCAQSDWGRVLQQNSAVPFVCPHAINHPEACVPETVKATFCSKTAPFFSCDSNKFCPDSI